MSDSSLTNEDAKVIALRPATVDDERFLFELYASTRGDELAALGWNDQQRETFLRMQYNMQRRVYPEADNYIVLLQGREVGRFLSKRSEEEFHLVDITILPEFRNHGIGTKVIRDHQEEATLNAKPIRLHVLASNFAKRLYERLGFVLIDGDDADISGAKAYLHMIWVPPTTH